MKLLTKAEKTDGLLCCAALSVILILTAAVCLFFAGRKSGLFIDEVYSYGLANSHYAPFAADLKGGTIHDSLFTREELENYLSVSRDELFDVGSVYYNQTRDVHPPLYYWLLNAVCSVFSFAGFTKWTGLGLNLLLYLASLIMLFLLSREIGAGCWTSCACTAAYGLSVIGISTFLMIRMYALLTLLTLTLAFFTSRLLKTEKKKYYFFLFLSIFFGLITQYYFVFYAFFLCLAYCIFFTVKKKWKLLFSFALSALSGVGTAIAFFPACLRHIFVGNGEVVSGSNALENLVSTSAYAEKIRTYLESFRQTKSFLWLLVLSVAFSGICLIISLKMKTSSGSSGRKNLSARPAVSRSLFFIVCVPAFLTFLLVSVVSPVLERRYIYNVIPFFSLAIAYLVSEAVPEGFDALKESAGYRKFEKILCIAFLVLLSAASLYELRLTPPDYLFPETDQKNAILEEYAACPCVYYSGDYSSPITSDMPILLNFKDVFVTDDTESKKLKEYIGNSEHYILFISNSWYWANSAPPQVALSCLQRETGVSAPTLLFEGDISLTYLMKKES